MFSIVLALLQIASSFLSSFVEHKGVVLSYTVKHTRIVSVVSFEETGVVKARVDCYMQKEIHQ